MLFMRYVSFNIPLEPWKNDLKIPFLTTVAETCLL